jgi:hypothetical protein
VSSNAQKCNYCDKLVPFVQGRTSTSNLKSHKCVKERLLSTGQTTLEGYHLTNSRMTPSQKKDITRLLLKVISEDDRPFALSASNAFKQFVFSLNSRYSLPDVKTLKVYLTEYESIAIGNLKKVISDINACAITLDLWTSVTKDHYIVFTLHYIQNWTLKSTILGCSEIKAIHTDHKVIMKSMEDMRNRFSLNTKQIKRYATDAGGNVVKAVDESDGSHLHCLCHNLNLCCQDAIEILSKLRSQCRRICTLFHTSNVAIAKLREIQKEDNEFFGFTNICYKLIQEVVTRWNSTFHMFKRIVLLADNINDINRSK